MGLFCVVSRFAPVFDRYLENFRWGSGFFENRDPISGSRTLVGDWKRGSGCGREAPSLDPRIDSTVK